MWGIGFDSKPIFKSMIKFHNMMIIALWFSLFLVFMVDADQHIAIGAQGLAQEMMKWSVLFDRTVDTRIAHLFLLSYDEPINQNHSNITHVFLPNSTWTVGRNHLARMMYRKEIDQRKAYKYWSFSDADAIAAIHCNAPQKTHCLARYVNFLAKSSTVASIVNIGVVFRNKNPKHIMHQQNHDCSDAIQTAFHRSAVPIYLPYVEKMDELSFYESQVIIHRVAAGCIPRGGITDEFIFYSGGGKHGIYPRGFFDEHRKHALDIIFGSRRVSPHPIVADDTFPPNSDIYGDCSRYPSQLREIANRTENYSMQSSHALSGLNQYEILIQEELNTESHPNINRWWETVEYKYCHKALMSRFKKFMSSDVSLDSIDGPKFASGSLSKYVSYMQSSRSPSVNLEIAKAYLDLSIPEKKECLSYVNQVLAISPTDTNALNLSKVCSFI